MWQGDLREKHLSQSGGRRSEGKTETKAVIVVSLERTGRSRGSRFRIGWFEELWWVLGCRSCPWLSDTWLWGMGHVDNGLEYDHLKRDVVGV